MSNDLIRRPAKAVALLEGSYTALPINPEFYLRKEGLKIKRPSVATNCNSPGELFLDTKTVVLSSSPDDANRRFSAARLLGLYYAFTLPELAELSTLQQERYADAFAIELLMPEKAIRKAWYDGQTESEMCALFGVTPATLDARLKQIGIL